jgi:hypothetical protein
VEVSHGVIPGLSGVGIDLPSVSLLCGSPVWDSETLVECSWLSVETGVSYSLEEIVWMEVLSPNVVHDIWLLVEFLTVEVLNSDSDLSCLFYMESVGAECNVWM